jgi:hypothetical protein
VGLHLKQTTGYQPYVSYNGETIFEEHYGDFDNHKLLGNFIIADGVFIGALGCYFSGPDGGVLGAFSGSHGVELDGTSIDAAREHGREQHAAARPRCP